VVRVAVVGGGLAGMTAALRLSQRGFKVTLYEAKDQLGGNLSSEKNNGVFHDVYPHMFCEWYANFWSLFEQDLRLKRDQHFSPRMGVKLKNPKDDHYRDLKNATTIEAILDNLTSGVASPPDMFLLGFSGLDLASHPFNRHGADELDRLDVNGFIYSRGYSTEKLAKLQNYILTVIWSIQSDITAAASYQDFVKHSYNFPKETPFAWLPKGDLFSTIIAPWEAKLAALGCEIRKATPIAEVTLVGGVPKLKLEVKDAGGAARAVDAPEVDYVVMATSAPALAQLALKGPVGQRIVDALPHLSQLQRFQEIAIPVVDVYFKKKLRGMPKEQVGFVECDMALTMLDISQLWVDDPNMKGRTALVLAASDGYALPSNDPDEQGHLMIQELAKLMPIFNPGERWGDPKADIDWELSHFRSNQQNKLFLNDIGSWQYRPHASDMNTSRLFLAGDFCMTDVNMATVEAAVQSGLTAASDLQIWDAGPAGRLRGDPITLVEHDVYSNGAMLAAKLALLPLAYAATAWSAFLDDREQLKKGPLPKDAYSPLSYTLVLPQAFALDWWKTFYWLVRNLMPSSGLGDTSGDHLIRLPGEPGSSRASKQAGRRDTLETVAAQALDVAGDALHAFSKRLPSRGQSGSKLGEALAGFTEQAWRAAAAAADLLPAASSDAAGYVRRWRRKS
jgi:hypothetical protein